jgi:hypothetical protein
MRAAKERENLGENATVAVRGGIVLVLAFARVADRGTALSIVFPCEAVKLRGQGHRERRGRSRERLRDLPTNPATHQLLQHPFQIRARPRSHMAHCIGLARGPKDIQNAPPDQALHYT